MTVDRRLPTDDWLVDAANFPGGHAAGIVFPRSTEDVVDALASSESVLVVGAQSSLTGGATPMGETIVATTKMARIVDVAPGRITVEPGVTVAAMQERLRAEGALVCSGSDLHRRVRRRHCRDQRGRRRHLQVRQHAWTGWKR